MDDERVRLGQDLVEKLDALFAVYEQPIVRVDGYFSDLRNQIDFEAEGLLERFETDVGDVEQVESFHRTVNSDRERYIAILKEIEAKIVKQLPAETRQASEAYASLIQRVEEFKTAAEADISALEDNYVRLALEIMNETNELERRTLGNQTVIFSCSKYEMKLGPLIHLTHDFLNQDEIDALMSISYFMVRVESIHELLEKMLNRRLLVGASRPFNLTKNMLVMERLDCILMSEKNKERLNGQYLRFENSRIQIQDPEPDTGPAPHRIFSLGIHTYRLPSLAAELAPFAEHIVELQIADNDLESLNETLLAKCTSLRELQLLNFCEPETKFGIGFLASLSNLEKLELTLPDVPLDFGVLESLAKLDYLRLEGSSRMDTARPHSKMAAKAFKQLIDLSRLRELALAFFEIEATNEDLFKHSLQTLEFTNVKLDKDALKPSDDAEFDSELAELTLSKSRIVELPVGAFDRLVNLETLNLSHNHIREIKQGVFSQLVRLSNLKLDHNPIESIEDDAFTLPSLSILSLNNCRLRSINGQMFTGLVNLEVLELENNEIETIEVATVAAASVRLGKSAANTTPEQLEIVKASLFRDLEMLRRLSLKGNRLEKLDLNWFYNLKDLYCLDVSSNLINELNESTAPSTLSELAELNLANNRLVFVDKKTLAPFGELKKFYISQNPLERIDLSFLARLQHLRIVHLQDTRLQMTITRDTFAPPARFISSLMELDIRNSQARVELGTFQALPKLEKLRMDMSTLAVDSLQDAASWKSVPFFGSVPTLMEELVLQNMDAQMRDLAVARFDVSSYYPAYRLKKLSLVKCALKTLDGFGWEQNFSLLTHLDVSGNLLTTLEADSLGHMPNLSSLNLANNLIETLNDPTLFEKLPRLQELNLSGNRLKSIRRGLFQGLGVDLTSLDLSNNALAGVDHGLFRGLRSLTVLDLSGNGISSLDLARLFKLCQRLEKLRLSHNALDHRAVNEAAMSGAFRLTELALASNRLDNMDFVGALRKLHKLDLSDNRIASTSKDGVSLLGRLTALTHLNLSGNCLPETVSVEATLARLKPNLVHLDLSRNPLQTTANLTE